jgi:lipoprotein-anchoring transpeptidase ErfK/SrfK
VALQLQRSHRVFLRRRAAVLVLGAVAVFGIASSILVAVPAAPASDRSPLSLEARPIRPAPAPATQISQAAGPITEVAVLWGDTPGSMTPGGPSTLTVPGSWYGYQSELPVIAMTPGWLEVRLAQRPNESTAWIPASAATLTSTPYALALSLSDEHLRVYLDGQLVDDFPAGIGTAQTPTVTGSYFVTMMAPAPDPGYGPFILVTSAHSDAIADWDNSGDAIIAIHGPITSDVDALIGNTGAQVSNGCIRLHDADLTQLASIPPGTPLDITP